MYAARCEVGGKTYPAALSIGRLPTFGPDEPHQVEAYLVGFDGDLYGQTLTVEVIDWLREQRKYSSLEALKAQLHEDVRVTVRLSGIDPSVPIAAA